MKRLMTKHCSTGWQLGMPCLRFSRVRLEQTIYAEYPRLKAKVQALEHEKTQQSAETLKKVWGTNEEDTLNFAQQLVEVGVFEKRGEKAAPKFWVPFLYRDALDMVQGSAEELEGRLES